MQHQFKGVLKLCRNIKFKDGAKIWENKFSVTKINESNYEAIWHSGQKAYDLMLPLFSSQYFTFVEVSFNISAYILFTYHALSQWDVYLFELVRST